MKRDRVIHAVLWVVWPAIVFAAVWIGINFLNQHDAGAATPHRPASRIVLVYLEGPWTDGRPMAVDAAGIHSRGPCMRDGSALAKLVGYRGVVWVRCTDFPVTFNPDPGGVVFPPNRRAWPT